LKIEVPLISVIIGEGGSGGAVALASSNVVLMLEYSVYSVISPEGCASILWRTRDKSADAAKALKLTSKELLKHSVIEGVIPEPIGGAHRDPDATIQRTADELERTLRPLLKLSGKVLRNKRRERFLSIGREKTPQRKAVGFMAKA
jgi:acetyl-CoA carboxylase carboxyl transferase subunit alpha